MFSYIFIIIICYSSTMISIGDTEIGIASKQNSEKIQRRCPYSLRKLWQTDISSFPFAAAPLIADMDGDGGLDVVAAPFGESLAVIEGETGWHLENTNWPQHNLDKSVHSSPLQYDIDRDGNLDVLFVTTQGEGLFYTGLGHALHKFTFQLQPAYVKAHWYKDVVAVGHDNILSYVSTNPVMNYIPVDAHVLSTPVLHNMRYLIIPVSFYFSDDDYHDSNFTGPWGDPGSRGKFYVTAIAALDLIELQAFKKSSGSGSKDSRSFTKLYFLELSQNPVFNLFTPTVIDIDGDFSAAEIITGPSSGNLYVLSLDGNIRAGFPQALGSLSGRISAASFDQSPELDLIALDTSGKVVCLSSATGKIKWSTQVGGRSFPGSRIVDVDLDGQLDIVVATDEGKVFALNGLNGSVLPKYPYNAGRRIAGHVLITKFNAIRAPFDLVFLSDNGILHILASDLSCLSQVAVADSSLVDIVSQNIVLLNGGMEFIVATSDGSLICLGSGSETPIGEMVDVEYRMLQQRMISPPDSASYNDFPFSMNKIIVMIDDKTRFLKEVTGSSLDLYFSIFGAERDEKFNLMVYMGSSLVHSETQITRETTPTWLKVPTPEQPGQAQVTVVIYDKNGFASSDFIFIKFNQLILLDLQWLVLAPYIAMVIILLVNHGFPAKDLLPVTFPFKAK